MNLNELQNSLPEPLVSHLQRMVGDDGEFASPRDYICSLIERDMDESDVERVEKGIREGYSDIQEGRIFQSSGDFFEDRKRFRSLEQNDWK